MSNFFVTRHHGAIEWAAQLGIQAQLVTHFDPAVIQAGDLVIGSLPVNLVAKINEAGGRYLHLTLDLPAEARGKELTAADMVSYGARLEGFYVNSADCAQFQAPVGAWDDFNGEYGPEREHGIEGEITVQGAILKLNSPGIEQRDLYIERLPDAWRINICMDEMDVSAQIVLADDDTVTFV